MSLFDVPGWTVPAVPAAQNASTSKKRKRPANDDADNIKMAAVNLEKLMRTLGDPDADKPSGKEKKRARQKAPKEAYATDKTKGTKGQLPAAINSPRKQDKAGRGDDRPPAKKGKKVDHKGKSEPDPHNPRNRNATASGAQTPGTGSKMTTLQEKMRDSLGGARFRWINEELYKSNSAHAHQLMRDDPQVFEEYHIGFRHQVQSWPTNPVSHYTSQLSSYSPRTVIADLGCGDAALARALIPKGMTVLSFDLVSDGAYVIEADTCEKLPLPGSDSKDDESSEGEGHVVDVVVCALSLMGTNWPRMIQESWRVLKPKGELKIAEVASRLTDRDAFVSLVSEFGFRLVSKDDSNTHFTLFEFKKRPRKAGSRKHMVKLLSKGDLLKPCEYKRR